MSTPKKHPAFIAWVDRPFFVLGKKVEIGTQLKICPSRQSIFIGALGPYSFSTISDPEEMLFYKNPPPPPEPMVLKSENWLVVKKKKGPFGRLVDDWEEKIQELKYKLKKEARDFITEIERELNNGLLAEEAESAYARMGLHEKEIFVVTTRRKKIS